MRKTVLPLIKPSKAEEKELKKIAKEIIQSIKIPNAKLEMGGSSSKDTWLKGNHDIDIYVKFDPKKYAGLNISKTLEKHIPQAKVLHGSRDYFQLEHKGYEIELIPIMDIKKVEDAQNITDISPFHKKWVRKHKKFTDDIRLAKAFAKANNIYGAESYIRGFSGYALEVLTIYYGGFENLIANVSEWRTRTIIDPENYHKGRVRLNKSKTQCPLVLVDPVQKTRNVTAVVSTEKYKLFKKICKKFVKNPSDQFFYKEEFSLEKLKADKGDNHLIVIEVNPLEGKRDIVGAKLLKSFEFLKKQLNKHEFKIVKSGWDWQDTAQLWFMVENVKLSQTVKHFGPPLDKLERIKLFKAKWAGYSIKKENNKAYIIKDRLHKTPLSSIKASIKDPYFTSRIDKYLNHKKL